MICPFCSATADGPTCHQCGRNTKAARRPCSACQEFSPTDEPNCSHCGTKFGNDLVWKVPVIIAMFVLAFIISFAIAFVR